MGLSTWPAKRSLTTAAAVTSSGCRSPRHLRRGLKKVCVAWRRRSRRSWRRTTRNRLPGQLADWRDRQVRQRWRRRLRHRERPHTFQSASKHQHLSRAIVGWNDEHRHIDECFRQRELTRFLPGFPIERAQRWRLAWHTDIGADQHGTAGRTIVKILVPEAGAVAEVQSRQQIVKAREID